MCHRRNTSNRFFRFFDCVLQVVYFRSNLRFHHRNFLKFQLLVLIRLHVLLGVAKDKTVLVGDDFAGVAAYGNGFLLAHVCGEGASYEWILLSGVILLAGFKIPIIRLRTQRKRLPLLHVFSKKVLPVFQICVELFRAVTVFYPGALHRHIMSLIISPPRRLLIHFLKRSNPYEFLNLW